MVLREVKVPVITEVGNLTMFWKIASKISGTVLCVAGPMFGNFAELVGLGSVESLDRWHCRLNKVSKPRRAGQSDIANLYCLGYRVAARAYAVIQTRVTSEGKQNPVALRCVLVFL